MQNAFGDYQHRGDGDYASIAQPGEKLCGGGDPISPATTNAQMSANTAGTLPVVIATSVAMTITAATNAIPGIIDPCDACRTLFAGLSPSPE